MEVSGQVDSWAPWISVDTAWCVGCIVAEKCESWCGDGSYKREG